MALRPCLVCGEPTRGPRCAAHARRARADVDETYRSRQLRRAVLRAWRAAHGNVCPGYRRPAHVAFDLTVDHIVPLAQGGQPTDRRNLAVLCRACNGSKGAR